jgi:hypothetical protein
MRMFLAKNVEALRWKRYYPLLPLWLEYRNAFRARRAADVKSAVRLLHALMEAHADVDKNMDRR